MSENEEIIGNRRYLAADRILLPLLAMYCLTTLLQRLPMFASLNRFLVFPVLTLILISLFFHKADRWIYVALAVFAAAWVISCALTTWTNQALVQAPRSLFCVMVLFYFYTRFDIIKYLLSHHWKIYQGILFVWTVVVLLSIPMESSWVSRWGGADYFVSYTNSAFQLMPTAMIAMTVNMLCSICGQKNWITLAYSVIPLWAGLQGGSRTYLILIVLMFFAMLATMHLSKFQRNTVIVLFGIIGIGLLSTSGFIAKMLSATSAQEQLYSGFDFLGTLTSGRSVFWIYDLNAFFDLSLPQQLVGNGFSFSFLVNKEAVGNSIFAHNDFINILMELGYIGLGVYLAAVLSYIVKVGKQCKHSTYFVMLLFLVWFINAFINSFYPYTSSVIAFCFLGVTFAIATDKKLLKFQNNKKIKTSNKISISR